MLRRSSLSCFVPLAVYDTILMTSEVEADENLAAPAFLSSFGERYLTLKEMVCIHRSKRSYCVYRM